MARKPNQSVVSSDDILKPKVTTRKRLSVKQFFLYSVGLCGACFVISILLPSKPKPADLPTAAALPTDVAAVGTSTAAPIIITLNSNELTSVGGTWTAFAVTINATQVVVQQLQNDALAGSATRDADMTALAVTKTSQASTNNLARGITEQDVESRHATWTAEASMPTATITDTPAPVVVVQAAVPTAASVVVQVVAADLLPYDETTYVIKIMDSLAIGAGGREIGTVRVANGRPNGGEIGVIVPYNTTESDPNAQVDEVLDIYRSVGVSISTNKLDVDSVTLIMGVNEAAALFMSATAKNTVDYAFGRMTSESFVGSLILTDMTGVAPATGSTGSSNTASTTRRETRMISATANVRTCPRRTDDCAVVVQLQPGASIIITGDVQGDTVSQSTLWYVAEYEGKVVYVHSTLVAAPGVTSLPAAPAVVQPTQGVIIIGSQNQSVAPIPQTSSGTGSTSCLTCSQYFSCTEARTALANGCTDLDADHDGIPCESLCGG